MNLARIALVIGLLPPSAIAAQHTHTPIVGIYSTLHYNPASGDVLGTEIIVSPADNGFQLSYQTADGVPGPVYRVTARVRGDSISFQLPPDTLQVMNGPTQVGVQLQPHPHFRGRITATGLRGRFDGEKNELLPRRVRSYWNRR